MVRELSRGEEPVQDRAEGAVYRELARLNAGEWTVEEEEWIVQRVVNRFLAALRPLFGVGR